MIIQAFPSGPFETNAYVVSCALRRRRLLLILHPDSANTIEAYLSQQHLSPIAILLTHIHWDHIADVAKIKKEI